MPVTNPQAATSLAKPSSTLKRLRWLVVLLLFTGLPLTILLVGLITRGWRAVVVLVLTVAAIVVFAKLVRHWRDPRLRRAVEAKLQGRPALTPEQFGQRHYPPELQPVAARLRRLLDQMFGFEVSGLEPGDSFLDLLRLEGPVSIDSLEDAFFEEIAVEYGLQFEDAAFEDFHTFDELLRYVGKRRSSAHEPHDAGEK